MTTEQIKQLTTEQYGGDFEMTVQVGAQVGAQDRVQVGDDR